MAHSVLIVEDEASLARNIKEYLAVEGFDARACGDGEAALGLLDSFRPDLAVLDLRLLGMDGLLLRTLRQRDPPIRVVILTAHGNVQTAVEAIKAGAYEFLSKPVVLSERLRVIDRALQEDQTGLDLTCRRRRDGSGLAAMHGESPAIRQLRDRIAQLLDAEAAMRGPPPVLIGGETGVAKELIARALHFDGPRATGPFIELNCAALPTALVEGELFGHERGAFADARKKRAGLIEAASGGTLFLDEVGELDLALQAKLLRVLESRTVRRLGAVRERPVDVRFLAATNRPLRELVDAGRFRADLYFRLSIIGLTAPPLRERGEDVLLLARHFLEQHARVYGRPVPRLLPLACVRLLAHDWPGNVRELRNMLEQVVVFSAGGDLDATAFPMLAAAPRAIERAGFLLPEDGIDLEQVERSLTLRPWSAPVGI
jgi:DNA-binding NtrC family response regulator